MSYAFSLIALHRVTAPARIRRVACCAVLSVGSLAASVVVAQTPPRRAVAPPTFTMGQNIEASDLQASATTVTEGQTVTFRMKLKNTGATLAPQVPWQLEINGRVEGNGVVQNLAAGAAQEFTKDWRAVAGAQTARFVIDPAGKAFSNGVPVDRRSRQMNVTVAALPATEVRLIDWEAAKAAGMQYAVGLEQPTTCVAFVGPILSATNANNFGADMSRYIGWIQVGIKCDATGGRMRPVVLDNLVLRNGWRVKDVRLEKAFAFRVSDWQYVSTPPAVGSDRPRIELRMWANSLGALSLALKVEIEGPRGTNPYR